MYITPKTMTAIKDESERLGVSRSALMENAGGRLCLFIMDEIYPNLDITDGVCILAGSGNNGGDGLTLAKNLSDAGLPVNVIMVCGEPTSKLARERYDAVKNVPEVRILDNTGDLAAAYGLIASASLIVDCVFGTGYKSDTGTKRSAGAKAFLQFAAKQSAVKIAADIPSGGDALTGAYDFTVKYDYTISMGFDKIGLMYAPLRDFAGQVVTVDIGIPDSARPPESAGIGEFTFDAKTVFAPRPEDCHKGDFGKALIVAGSSRYSGAAYFAAAGAVRSGAGLVTLGGIKDVCDRVGSALPEVMFLPLAADKNGFIGVTGAKDLRQEISRTDFDVIAFGCGIGDSPAAAEILTTVIETGTCTKIIDADGIKALAANIECLKKKNGEIIITPHAAELAKLFDITVSEAVKNRLDYARSFAKEHGITVVAKGVPTYVCGKDGGVLVVKSGNPGLARGGSGDVLTGILTGICANRSRRKGTADVCENAVCENAVCENAVCENVCAAVGLHGAAADKAAAAFTVHCMSACDVINSIPEVFKGC
jgi:NAD(P)H-hydrate epimerase